MSRGRWRSIPYAPLSPRQYDGINRQEAENRQMKKLGCRPMLVEQKRYVLDGEELDFKVWVSCTCLKWMAGGWFPTLTHALAAHDMHTGAAA